MALRRHDEAWYRAHEQDCHEAWKELQALPGTMPLEKAAKLLPVLTEWERLRDELPRLRRAKRA